MSRPALVVALSVVIVALMAPIGLAVAAPAAGAVSHFAGTMSPRTLGSTSALSYNWAGYGTTAANGAVTKVTAAWVQPVVTCTSTTSIAAFWTGIDGFNSGTVEQTGTIVECISGTPYYYSWWEMYPLNAVQIVGSVSPGDHISASVTYHSGTGKFTMKFTDITAGTGFTKTSYQAGTNESSAECIAEAPGGASTTSGLYPLADFGKVRFSSCTATISGTTSGIGGFSTVYAVTMVNYPGATRVLASVGALSASNKAFTVVWHHAS